MRVVLSNASSLWGGVHVVTEALATGLQARGHDVLVLCRPGLALEARLRGRVPLAPVLGATDLNPLTIARCVRSLRRHRAEVAITLTEKDVRLTGPACALLRIPFVVRRANDRPLKREPHFRFLYGRLPARHVANSQATRHTMLSSASWLAAEAVTVIHNGIDVDAIARAEPAELGVPAGALVFGFLGRFDERKGLLDLARAWPRVAAALPDAHLAIAGKGPLEVEARAMLADAPRVVWAGYRTDAAGFLRAVDVLAVPSHWEGFGLVAAEALAAGAAVVASRASSLPEIVRDGVDGLLVEPRDPDGLADALIRIGSDAELRARLAAAGLRRVRSEFSVETMLGRYEALLADVIRSAGQGRARP